MINIRIRVNFQSGSMFQLRFWLGLGVGLELGLV